MKRIKHRLLPALVIALLAIPTLVVFAKEIGSLTVTGPGIKGELTVNDQKLLMNLQKSGFFDHVALSKPPTGLNTEGGYFVAVSLDLDGKIVPFVEMIYYPTEEGQPAYIHYTGRMKGEKIQPVDEWGLLNRSADAAFREIMSVNDVALQSALVKASVKSESPAVSAAEPVAVPAAAPSQSQIPYGALAMAAILLFLGAGLFIQRRSINSAH